MATESAGTAGKALSVLTLLVNHPNGVTAARMAEEVDHPFSTVHQLLNTLVRSEYATYDPREKKYRLGVQVCAPAQKVASAHGFEGAVVPILQRLTEQTGGSSILAMLDGDGFRTVRKVDGPQFRTTTGPGDHGTLHTSAAGKALPAFSGRAIREHLPDTIELMPRTEHSVTDRDELRRQVEQIGAQGRVGQQEEHDIGMAALAGPALSPSKRLTVALTLAAPLFRTDLAGLQRYVPALQQTASELALELPPQH